MDDWTPQPTPRPLDSMARRLWRARGRLSRAKAAPALGLSEKTLQRIENGRSDPTIHQVRTAAELYGVSLQWLLFGEGAPDPGLAGYGPDLAELLRAFMRDRFGCERVEQLSEAQRRAVNAQAESLIALVRLSQGGRRLGEG